MFAGDVGGKQGGADGDPADIAAGEEVIASIAFVAGMVIADGEDDEEVDDDDGRVEHWGIVYTEWGWWSERREV